MYDLLARQMLGQRLAGRFLNAALRGGRFSRRPLRLGGLQLFEPQLQLIDLARELLRGAAELHSPQLRDQQLELIDLDRGGVELGALRE